MRRTALVLCVAALATRPAPTTAQQFQIQVDDPGLATLAAEVARLAEAARGTVGVAAYHLETERGFTLNGDQRFPMASTYKVPIAVRILSLVDAGEIALGDLVEIEQRDVYLTASTISDLIDDPGLQISIHNLLEMMLQTSDNIATDVLMRVAGGAAAVTAHMAGAGIDGIRVDRPTWALIANWLGAAEVSEANRIDPGPYRELPRSGADRCGHRGPERCLQPRSARHCHPCRHGGAASGDLGAGAALRGEFRAAHRHHVPLPDRRGPAQGRAAPGHSGGPQDRHDRADDQRRGDHRPSGRRGHVVAVVYIKESAIETYADREPVIAHIARAIHDYFVFNGR